MEAAQCRLCGNRHWGACAPVSTKTANTVSTKPANRPSVSTQAANTCKACSEKDAEIARLRALIAPKAKKDRREYQRDLMRKRRAIARTIAAR